MSTGNPIFGWFDRAEQTEPTYRPPLDSPCLYCGKPVTREDVRTHSMMAMSDTNPARSYFYRTHRTCDEAAQAEGRESMDDVVWEAIRHHERAA